jgi:hypothetical protein
LFQQIARASKINLENTHQQIETITRHRRLTEVRLAVATHPVSSTAAVIVHEPIRPAAVRERARATTSARLYRRII